MNESTEHTVVLQNWRTLGHLGHLGSARRLRRLQLPVFRTSHGKVLHATTNFTLGTSKDIHNDVQDNKWCIEMNCS